MSASRRVYEQRMIQRRDQEQAHENLGKNLGSDVWAAKGECTSVAQKVFSP